MAPGTVNDLGRWLEWLAVGHEPWMLDGDGRGAEILPPNQSRSLTVLLLFYGISW